MADVPEAGTVNAEQALMLLLLDVPHDLKILEREGAITQIAKGRYWLKDLVQGYIKHLRAKAFTTDTKTLAAALGVASQRVSQLEHEGWFKQHEKRGKYNWIEAVNGYCRYMRDENRRSSKSASDVRIKDAKAQEIEVRTRQRLGRLIPLEVYEEMIDSIAGMVRSEFAGLAAASTRDLTMRRIIEREVNARLRRVAEAAMAQAIRLEKVRSSDDAIGADGTGHMGGAEPDLPADSGSAGAERPTADAVRG